MPHPAGRDGSPSRPSFPTCLAAILALTALVPLAAQVRPIYSEGAAGLVQKLQRLTTTASAMHTGAHPDDEDSALIARLARGDHARVAYLSLNRGEGGQNILGPEFYEALGVIRTEELLQARALDGGDQFFTRVVDFGYTTNMAETERKWGRAVVLGDMVRAIRLYRPLVVLSRFSGTEADGHGNHQLAGHLTPLAIEAAADPAQFPEHLAEGLRPWRARKFYRGMGFRPVPGTEPTLRLQTGVFDPALGRSYFEIAMEGRTQHKTQEMGAPLLRGVQASALRAVETAVTPAAPATGETSVFDGIDVSVRGLARLAGLPDGTLAEPLGVMDEAARRALADLDVRDPSAVVATLARGLTAARGARASLASLQADADAKAEADFLLAQKVRQFEDALVHASGVTFDAVSQTETLVPGATTTVSVRAFVPEGSPVTVGTMSVAAPGWAIADTEPPTPPPGNMYARLFREQPSAVVHKTITAPGDARPTQPYWLEERGTGDVFTWAPQGPKSVPLAPPLVEGLLALTVGGVPVEVRTPVQFRTVDPVRGELRRPLAVVPALSVAITPGLEIVKLSQRTAARDVTVRVDSHASTAVDGDVVLDLPPGWTSDPVSVPVSIARAGEGVTARFRVTPAATASVGPYRIAARARAGGRTYTERLRVLAYPHIQTHRMYEPAVLDVQVIDLDVAPLTLGYIMGTGDEVPVGLRLMGVDVTLLTPTDVASGDLARFDAIMVGVRASEVRPDFVANISRLHDYVRDGGTLVVQEQHEIYTSRNLAPFPGEIGSRVTDEEAPVTILQPTHPVFTFPNRIGPSDFAGWIQERNAYGFRTWDDRYTPLLESHDPWDTEQKGALLYARVGKGHYVYSAYSWFRQLPDGVPGAYRIVANLISLGKAPQ
jgi:LmbE family N-acetylglucosaminyl deacetylase